MPTKKPLAKKPGPRAAPKRPKATETAASPKPVETKAQAPKPTAVVCADHNRRTCIAFKRVAGMVFYSPLDIEGFEVMEMEAEKFDSIYQPLPDYPVDRAAKLYAGYAVQLGGSPEAMKELAALTTITEKEIEMAAAKKAASAAKKPAAKPAAKASKTKEAAVKKAVKAAGEKRPSAAQMFKDLIMKGTFSDDVIFSKVQKEFGLDDNKRSYVNWYRKDLEKKGMKPPAAKGS